MARPETDAYIAGLTAGDFAAIDKLVARKSERYDIISSKLALKLQGSPWRDWVQYNGSVQQLMLARDKRKQAEQQSEHNPAEVLDIACLPYAGLQLAPASNVDRRC